MKRRCRPRRFGIPSIRGPSRGAAAVELAVCAPFLILLVFGMIDVGRAIMVHHLLTTATRDGARTAILEGVTAEEVQQDVQGYLADVGVPGATVVVNPSPLTTADIGDPVTVTAEVPFESVSWLPSSFYLKGLILRGKVVMRREVSSSDSGTEN